MSDLPQDPSIPTPRPESPRRSPTIEELMTRLADGDDGALGPLFDAVAPVVRRYLAQRMAADRIDATMQTIMLELHRGRSSYRPDADVMTQAFSFAQFLVKDAGSISTLDDDVIDLVRAGLHAKQVAAILDISPTKVRASVEEHRKRIEALLVEDERLKGGSASRLRPSTPPASELVGNVIDRYHIEALIGTGGFGNVYRATRSDGEEVAIKVMREIPDADGRAVARFKHEVRTMHDIGAHPNIVRVDNHGELPDGRGWYAMTLLDGQPLDRLVGTGTKMQWARVARLVRQLCSALAVVHEKQIVHGDVKPANCFITDVDQDNETLRLLDFGLARRATCGDAHRAIAPLGAIDGTLQYVAPELLRGRAPDKRADVYAIGVMMFEMLTGRAPFAAEGFAALVVAKTVHPIPTLAARADGLQFPRGVETIVRRAMHQDPAQRFGSVELLAAAIAALGPTGRRSAPLWSLGRDARVRLAATASISALAASLATALIVRDSDASSTPFVGSLTEAHVEETVEKVRPQFARCREAHGDEPAPQRASLRVLGATGQVTSVPKMNAHADGSPAECMRAVLFELRFPRFEVGEVVVGVDL